MKNLSPQRQLQFWGIGFLLMGGYVAWLLLPEPRLLTTATVSLAVIGYLGLVFLLFSGYWCLHKAGQPDSQNRVTAFREHSPLLFQFSVSLGFYAFILVLAEGFFALLLWHGGSQVTYPKDSPRFFVPDEALGYKPKSGITLQVEKRFQGKTVYDATYTIDTFGRRITPGQTNNQPKSDFAAFFGCSMTFGEGVGNNETLPACFSRELPAWEVYNYGCTGYGPQSLLAKVSTPEFRGEVSPSRGMAFFTFFDNHMNRAVDCFEMHNAWGKDLPCYLLAPDGILTRRGTFETGQPFRAMLFRMFWRSPFIRYSRLDYPFSFSSDDFKLVAGMFGEAQKKLVETFPRCLLYVLFFPGSGYSRELIPFLRQEKVPFLDYSGLIDITDKIHYIEHDGHPTPLAYQKVAGQLAKDLSGLIKEP